MMEQGRGSGLARAGGPYTSGGWLARFWVGSTDRLLRGFEIGIVQGTIDVTLPDGTRRRVGGKSPGIEAQITLKSWNALLRGASGGSVGVYKSWEAGEWESEDPAALFAVISANSANLSQQLRARGPWRLAGRLLHWLHRNSRSGSRRNIHAHYDLGNDFYAAWLDSDLIYSSARFDGGARDLAGAQQRKLDAVADRVAGAHSVLEVGCGWGALAQRLHERGMAVTAISLSQAQLDWASATRAAAIDFRNQDYRDVTGQFDAIVSVEMVEAVGQQYWDTFFAALSRCLKPGGRAAIQYIAIRDDLFEAYARSADFIQTYIFPGGMLVSESRFRQLAAQYGLDWRDQVDFPMDYAQTLRIWRERFDSAVAEARLPRGFDDRFVRLWRFYLMYCEGGFRGGLISVAQVTLDKRA